MDEKQGLPLVAQKSHFASIAIKYNPRLPSSYLFSNFWITSVWAPRLSLTLYIGENNQELFLDYFSFPFSFSLKKMNKKTLSHFFLSCEKDELSFPIWLLEKKK